MPRNRVIWEGDYTPVFVKRWDFVDRDRNVSCSTYSTHAPDGRWLLIGVFFPTREPRIIPAPPPGTPTRDERSDIPAPADSADDPLVIDLVMEEDEEMERADEEIRVAEANLQRAEQALEELQRTERQREERAREGRSSLREG